jgi:hypothetical protein
MTSLPREWLQVIGEFKPTESEYGNWFTPYLTGPYDACYACFVRELLRDRVSWGEGVPTDMFVLSIGEAPSRRATKIGGLPYFGRDRPWPAAEDGRPLPFLAQFDFAESTDIAEGVPGDVLLLFADLDLRDGLVTRWEKAISPDDLVTPEDMPVAPVVPSFYGTRWRTVNYPDWEPLVGDCCDILELEDGREVLDIYFAPEFLGMQIGSSPFRTSPKNPTLGDGERILCMLSNVVPTPDQPYPFLNRAAPIAMDHLEEYSLVISYLPPWDADAFGLLYIIQTKEGSLRWALHNL